MFLGKNTRINPTSLAYYVWFQLITYKSSGSDTVGKASFDNCVFSISSRTIQSGLTVTDDSLCLIWFGLL